MHLPPGQHHAQTTPSNEFFLCGSLPCLPSPRQNVLVHAMLFSVEVGYGHNNTLLRNGCGSHTLLIHSEPPRYTLRYGALEMAASVTWAQNFEYQSTMIMNCILPKNRADVYVVMAESMQSVMVVVLFSWTFCPHAGIFIHL